MIKIREDALFATYGGQGVGLEHDWTRSMVPDVLITPVLTVFTLQGLKLKTPPTGLVRR